jgi:hypothetical protein
MSCQRPTEGFHCRLPEGHDGPCPAWEDAYVEYGIRLLRNTGDLHRSGMTWPEAEAWIAEWVEDGGRSGVWEIVSREISKWETVHVR